MNTYSGMRFARVLFSFSGRVEGEFIDLRRDNNNNSHVAVGSSSSERK